jgi:3-phenylpropionate/trans-cinnamate dioxygenase ferredoxin reductase subunit
MSEPLKITVNRDTCRGYGNCVLAASDIFELDDDGLVVLLKQDVDEQQRGAVERAVYDCPTDSIATE